MACDTNMPCNAYNFDSGICGLAFILNTDFFGDVHDKTVYLNGNCQAPAPIFLFANISERLSYIGCYKFHNEDTNDCSPCTFNPNLGLNNALDTRDPPDTMTIGKCVRHCKGLGSSFAAIDKFICFCMNKWPLESLKVSNSLCPDKCIGETGARWNCGGFWRVSVYSIR